MTSFLAKKRAEILASVREFGEVASEAKGFIPGVTPVPVSGKVLDAADYVALVDASLDGWLTAGRFTEQFQRALAKFVGDVPLSGVIPGLSPMR